MEVGTKVTFDIGAAEPIFGHIIATHVAEDGRRLHEVREPVGNRYVYPEEQLTEA